MRIELALERRCLRAWQVEVARRLHAVPGVALGIRWSLAEAEEVPSCVETLLSLERVLYGTPARLSARSEPSDLSPYAGIGGFEPDIVIDLSGGKPSGGRRRWRLTFDGEAGDAPILAALLDGRAPVVSIADVDGGYVVADARPAIDAGGNVAAAFDDVLARTVSLVSAAVAGGRARRQLVASSSPLGCRRAALHGTKAIARSALARLSRLSRRSAHARTGWRFVSGPDTIDLQTRPSTGWRILPDDGARSYAQPFPIVTRGEAWMFVTEREFRSGGCRISAVKFGPDGPLGAPKPVLEAPSDLSYPFVFEAEGTIWMIPEAGGGSIDLYRASDFPGGWRHEARLVADVEAGAPTMFRHAGRWWLMATSRDGGLGSDMLHLWWSDEIRGPWRAHAANPVLIDAAAARPAGRLVDRGGRLIRPVQDCRTGRGRLALAEILLLDEERFEQRILGEVAASPAWPSAAVGTVNRARHIECIDGEDVPVMLAPPSANPVVATERPADA